MTSHTPATGAPTPPQFGFGDRLRLVRRDNGWTQERMAQVLTEHGYRVGKTTLGAWELGVGEPDRILNLAAALQAITGYPQVWWLGIDDTPNVRAA
jgi:transcriptional regulator with XRE-family HTH domain